MKQGAFSTRKVYLPACPFTNRIAAFTFASHRGVIPTAPSRARAVRGLVHHIKFMLFDTVPTTTPDGIAVDVRVRYAETDRMGVVYHANYLAWCEIGRTEFLRSRIASYAELESRGIQLAVAEASLRYHGGARYDEVVRVLTSLTGLRSRSMRFDYLITRLDGGERLVSAATTLISMNTDGRSVALLPEIRAALAPFVVELSAGRTGPSRALR